MGKHSMPSKRELKKQGKRDVKTITSDTNSRKTKKIIKKKKSNLLLYVIELVCIGLIVYSAINIYNWYKDSSNIQQESDVISNKVEIQEVNDTENVAVVASKEDKSSPYWDYIKMKLIDVDFSELEKINSDVSGWIQVSGTNINYPFVQASDNDYYLTRSFTKEYNEAGWVFLDYRNNVKSFDKNTIIYAHSRLDKAMFGSLKNLLKSDWYNNKNNHIIKLSTKNQNTLWQVFSVYHVPSTSDYLRTSFSSDSDFTSFANMLQNRSVYKFNTTVTKKDKILTLSTCYGKDERMVMHAKLIKYSNK